jgi:hypothetical protein
MSAERCTCFPTPPSQWTRYGSAVDPATQWQWNPECQEHPADDAPSGAREAVALLADLRDRLTRADSDLTAMAAAATGPSFTQARIGGKRDGVRLALSYLNEIERSQHV